MPVLFGWQIIIIKLNLLIRLVDCSQLSEQMGADGLFSVLGCCLFREFALLIRRQPLNSLSSPLNPSHHPFCSFSTHSKGRQQCNSFGWILFKARLSIYSTFTHLMMGFAPSCQFLVPSSLIPVPWALSPPTRQPPWLFINPPRKSEQMSVKRFKDVHVKCFILW